MSACTLAVVGHDEAPTLALAIEDALAARREADAVVYVDSGSRDGSVELAESMGVAVLAGPRGKGRAVSVVAEACATEWLVLLDADRVWSERSPARVLREAVAAFPDADMVVGAITFVDRELNLTRRLYEPMVAALFPEAREVGAPCPISGFRAVRAARARAALPFPPGYGLETWLNLSLGLAGASVETVEIGRYQEELGATIPAIGTDVCAAAFDLAESVGRLATGERERWEAWAGEVIDACAAGGGLGVVSPGTVAEVRPPI